MDNLHRAPITASLLGVLLMACPQPTPEGADATGTAASAGRQSRSQDAPGAERRQEERPRILEDTRITLDRSGCFGRCPSYTVSVNASGETRFLGRDDVARIEEIEGRISEEAVLRLLREFEMAGFSDLEEPLVCEEQWTDHATVTIELTQGGRTKTVSHDLGCRGFDQEQALMRLERVIDDVTWASQWVGAPEKRRSKWQSLRDRGPTSEKGLG